MRSQKTSRLSRRGITRTYSCCFDDFGPGAGAAVTAGGVLGDAAKLMPGLGDVEVLFENYYVHLYISLQVLLYYYCVSLRSNSKGIDSLHRRV